MNRYLAGLASLLQIKPILAMYSSKPSIERVRTRERASQRLLEMLRNVGPLERVAIVHAHAPHRVAELRSLAASLLPAEDVMVAEITPVIGAHIGPGAFGFAAVGARG